MHAQRGYEFVNEGRWIDSTEESDKAIELDPSLAEAYGNRGVAFYSIGQYDEAIADCNKAIDLNSSCKYLRQPVYGLPQHRSVPTGHRGQ